MNSKEILRYIVSPSRSVKERTLIVISGGSCSGKSYFAGQLLSELDKLSISASIVHLDNYFKDIDDASLPRNENGGRIFDEPDSYYGLDFIADVTKLIFGKSIRMPVYDKTVCKRIIGGEVDVKPANIIIAEGLFAINMLSGLESARKINIFFDISESVRLNRRIRRDTLRYGVSEDKVRKTFFDKVRPCHLKYVEPQKEKANIVINETGGE